MTLLRTPEKKKNSRQFQVRSCKVDRRSPWAPHWPQVKEYNHDTEAQQRSNEASDAMRADAESKRAALEQWCLNSYGEVCGWRKAVGTLSDSS